jgi:hypothetical protein
MVSTDEIAKAVKAAKVTKRLTVDESHAYLLGQAHSLHSYPYLDDLASDLADGSADKTMRGIAYHIENVRNELARELWQRGFNVGLYTLDEMLFAAMKNGETDLIRSVLDRLRRSEKAAQGLVVFPLHSLGILAAGLLKPFGGREFTLVRPGARFAITSQTNNFERTLEILNELKSGLGVVNELNPGLMRHWRESRGADWLERNPLLIARMTTIAGYYNETEFLLRGRLQVITAAIVMMAAMQPRQTDDRRKAFSSSRVNNWETLDIHHYLVLTGGKDGLLGGDAVPIYNSTQVREMSGLAVTIDPRHWRREGSRSRDIFSALETLFAGYLRHSVGTRTNTSIGNAHRKVLEAVAFFRRSFQPGRDDWTAAVSLATAFEMLLTDGYATGVTNRLLGRTRTLLRGVRGTRALQAAVSDLYEARSQIVHEGRVEELDLTEARQAFVLCFLKIMARLPHLGAKEPRPMDFLTG